MRQPDTPEQIAMRARLQDAIDRKNAERGRPLTNTERLENLKKFMENDDGK